MESEQHYLNVHQAADFLGVSVPTIRRALRKYRETNGAEGIEHSRIGHRTIRITRSALIAFVDQHVVSLKE